MNNRIVLTLCCLIFSLLTFAQASGGQIRRPTKRQSTKVMPSKPYRSTVKTEINPPEQSPPAIQPIPMSSLAKYNVVISTYAILSNAQGSCQKLRDEGWGAQIYLDGSNHYRVLMVGISDEPEAILYRNYARQTYPDAWILKIENGHESKYE